FFRLIVRRKTYRPKEGILFCAMHSYCESQVFPRSAKSDSKNDTSDREPDGSEQDRSQLNHEKEGKETCMTATSKESVSGREILLVGPYGVLGTGVIDA